MQERILKFFDKHNESFVFTFINDKFKEMFGFES